MNQLRAIWRAAGLKEKLILLIGIIYLLSPLDFIPEIILGPLGLLDDGGALIVMIMTLTAVYGRMKKQGDVIEGKIISPR